MNRRTITSLGVLVKLILFGLIVLIKPVDKVPVTSLMPSSDWLDFELPTSDGIAWSSTSIKDKVVILNFWAPWCMPCRSEIPYLIEAQLRYQLDILIVGIAIDQGTSVLKFEDEVGLNYVSLIGETEGITLMKHYGASDGLPLTLIFDRQRNLRHRILGPIKPRNFDQALKEVL